MSRLLKKMFHKKGNSIAPQEQDYSVWSQVRSRLLPEVTPKHRPTFKINKKDKIFTIGSCFARNIEDHLARLGYTVPMKSFAVPKEEAPHLVRPNGILNKFSPPAFFQEISWCERVRLQGGRVTFDDINKLIFKCDDRRVIDLHIGCYVPVSIDRALERRQEIYQVVSQIFSSPVIITTLGLVEVWFDLETNLFIQRVPTADMKNEMKRFKFVRLNYPDCYNYLQETISLVRKYNPESKFIITTSPIPLKHTFTGEDVIVANTYSKSVLRAVCGEIADKNRQVDYFPVFEMATLGRGEGVYQDDLRQIQDGFIKKMMARLEADYFEPAS